jgi:hypothetical protein
MSSDDSEFEVLSRRRVRLGVWIAATFVLVLASIAANDALVHAGLGHSSARVTVLTVLCASGVLLVVNLLRYAWLIRRSFTQRELRGRLWDELASANHVRSMAVGYLAMLALAVILAVISMFAELSGAWVVNGILVAAFAAPALGFAVLERRGGGPGA